jgi:DNA/RNA-binding domain of Phe-tRNA-synthetase-like protein
MTGLSAERQEWLDAASIDDSVLQLRPDYRALIVVAENVSGGECDAASDAWLARAAAPEVPLEHAHLEAWREAFREFGANARRTRPSVDALVRRASAGLPRIDRVTDIYNAISVLHVVPAGGEDLDGYSGPLRLTRADGSEPFDTIADGMPVVEHPEPGEVIWRDDSGVTCRRWNWRQCVRTRLSSTTTSAVFIFDALGPLGDDELAAVAEELIGALGNPPHGVRLLRGA